MGGAVFRNDQGKESVGVNGRVRSIKLFNIQSTRIHCPFIYPTWKPASSKLIIFPLLILYSFNVSLYLLNHLQTSCSSCAVNRTTASGFDLILRS
jgi:hypothetical protein